jgi:hypothetical protein
MFDILVSFRTFYFNNMNGDLMVDSKQIAKNYVFGGRFFFDLISSVPVSVLLLLIETQNSSFFSIIKILKLTRLFRLARMVSFLKLRSSLQTYLHMILIVCFLLLCIHFLNCYWMFIISVDESWFPPKDLDGRETHMFNSNNLDEYVINFYYAALVVIGAELLPTNQLELSSAIAMCILAPLIIGVIIGEFTEHIGNITRRQSRKSEQIDDMNTILYSLRINEGIQERICNFTQFN